MQRKIVSYVLLIIWLIIIFYLSDQSGLVSGENSSGIIECFFELFALDNSLIEIIHEPLREIMHIIEYLILGFLMVNVLKNYKLKSYLTISIMLCFIYSVTDEIHQAFVPSRTFQCFDILMDFSGIVVGSLIGNKMIKTYRNNL